MPDRACCPSRRTLHQHRLEISRRFATKEIGFSPGVEKAGIERGGRRHVLPEWDDTLLEPGTSRRLRAARYGENVGACISPYPLSDELPDPVVYARYGLVRICKVRRDGVEGISILVDDGRVARVVALEIKRESGLWELMRVDDHGEGGKEMLWWVSERDTDDPINIQMRDRCMPRNTVMV
jgi:hypothetical protein